LNFSDARGRKLGQSLSVSVPCIGQVLPPKTDARVFFQQEREEALERELSSKAAGGGIAAAALNKRAIGGEIVAAIREADGASEHSVPDELAGLSEAERKRAELRRALSQRIKEDLSAMA